MAVTLQWELELRGSPLPEAFKADLLALFREHGNKVHSQSRKSRKPVSIKTQYARVKNIPRAFLELRQGGFALKSPYSLAQKHVEYLVGYWVEHDQEVGTVENKLTYLRTAAEWMGKNDIVKRLRDYACVPADMKRSYVAEVDHSWAGRGIDVEKTIAAIEQTDRHVAMTLRLCAGFGLRRKEASMLRPGRVTPGKLKLPVIEGTKGGRPRQVDIEFLWQYELLEQACSLSHPERGSMIPPGYTPETWARHFYYVLEKHGVTKADLGVTTHGLRHGFSQDLYQRIAGVPAAIKGSAERPDAEAHKRATAAVVEAAGHSRRSKSNAYLSTFNHASRKPSPSLKDVEGALIVSEGNKAHAAKALGITRQSLYRILEKADK